MVYRLLGLTVVALGGLGTVLLVVPSTLFDLDRFTAPKELALHATALFALVLLIAGRRRTAPGVVEAMLTAFAGWSLGSAIFATNHWLALRALAVTTSAATLFWFARDLTRGSPGARRAAVLSLAVVLGIAAAAGLAEAHGLSSPLFARARTPGGLIGNRNFLAHLAVLGLPLAVWLAVTATRRSGRVVAGTLTALFTAIIVLSRSRAAWVGLAASLGIAAIAVWRRPASDRPRRMRLPALSLAIALGAAAAVLVPNRLEWSSRSPYQDSLRDVFNYREGSGRGRLIQYTNSLRLVGRDPVFGTGPGNWPVLYPLVTTPGDPSYDALDPMPTNPWPSSDWVAVLAERGPVGLALQAGIFAAIALICLRRWRLPDRDLRLRATAGLALLASAAVIGAFDALFLLAPPTFVAFAAWGALLPETGSVRGDGGPAPWIRWAAGAALVVTALGLARATAQVAGIVAAGSGWPIARLEAALRYDPASYRLRLLLAQRARCPEAREHARRAQTLFPHHQAPRDLSSRCR
jgi:O-antigen ligase